MPAVVLLFALASALDDRPSGVHLHASVEAAYLDGDAAVGAAVGAGVETAPFALHLKLPVWLRVVDLPPRVDPSLPAPCGVVRCDDFAPGGTFEPTALTRVVDELRLFRPGDLLHARAGPLYATFSHSHVVDGATNRLEFDRRGAGAYVESTLPFAGLSARAVALDLFRPHEQAAARVEAKPLAPFVGHADYDAVGAFLGRLTVGVEGGVDAVAPIDPASVDASGNVAANAPTRPIGMVAVDVAWPLFDLGFLQIAPYAIGSATTGFSVDGGTTAQQGAGVSAGVDVTLDAAFVVLDVDAFGSFDGPAHRRGIFDLAYSVERRRAFFGASVVDGGLARVPAPGGFGGGGALSVSVLSALALGARFDVEPAPGRNHAEVFLQGARGPVRGALRFVQRGWRDPLGLVTWGDGSILLAEAGVAIWGPFSLYGRWWRAPRFDVGPPRMEDDVFVGLSFDLALSPIW